MTKEEYIAGTIATFDAISELAKFSSKAIQEGADPHKIIEAYLVADNIHGSTLEIAKDHYEHVV